MIRRLTINDFFGDRLLDYQARSYNFLGGTFTTIDPLAEKYYDISPYAYCHNNPMNRIDPDGMDDVFINDKGEVIIVRTNDDYDRKFVKGIQEGKNLEKGWGSKNYKDAKTFNFLVTDEGKNWKNEYVKNDKGAIIGLYAYNFESYGEDATGISIDIGVLNLSDDGKFGFSQTYNASNEQTENDDGSYTTLPGGDGNDNNTDGYYSGTTWYSPSESAKGFDVLMSDTPHRIGIDIKWNGENSLIRSSKEGVQRILTISYGFEIINKRLTPNSVRILNSSNISPYHISKLPK